MEKTNSTEIIEQNLWNFLCACERLHTDSQEKQPEEILETDKQYLYLTICPCIESIRRYYNRHPTLKDSNPFNKAQPSDIQENDGKVLWALAKLRDEYLAHDNLSPLKEKDPVKFRDYCNRIVLEYQTLKKRQSSNVSNPDKSILKTLSELRNEYLTSRYYYPFKEMSSSHINNLSILRSGEELDIDLINTSLRRTVSKILGFENEDQLLADIQKKNFVNLTEMKLKNGEHYYHRLTEYLAAANEENDVLETMHGIRAGKVIRDIRKIGGFTREIHASHPTVAMIRNGALHDHIPIIPENLLQDGAAAYAQNSVLMMLYRHLIEKTNQLRRIDPNIKISGIDQNFKISTKPSQEVIEKVAKIRKGQQKS